ncbi:MAG TPA: Ig-like domain-containing protein [Gemmatimonadaceae bacterium]
MTWRHSVRVVVALAAVGGCSGSAEPVDRPILACGLGPQLNAATDSLRVSDTLRVKFTYIVGCDAVTTDQHATFSTGNAKVATVDATGLVTAKGVGTVTLTGASSIYSDVKAARALIVY